MSSDIEDYLPQDERRNDMESMWIYRHSKSPSLAQVSCPRCGGIFPEEHNTVGNAIYCPHCGHRMGALKNYSIPLRSVQEETRRRRERGA